MYSNQKRLYDRLIFEFHDTVLSGHLGQEKVYEKIHQYFFSLG